jgi:hypothetical protein
VRCHIKRAAGFEIMVINFKLLYFIISRRVLQQFRNIVDEDRNSNNNNNWIIGSTST